MSRTPPPPAPPDDERLPRLLARARDGVPAGTEAEGMDPNDLALLGAGSPTPDEREALLSRLAVAPADDAACVAALKRGAPSTGERSVRGTGIAAGAAPPRVRPLLRMLVLSAAAAALLLAGLLSLRRDVGDVTVRDDGALVTAFAHLRARAPDALVGLEPLLGPERRGPARSLRSLTVPIEAPLGALRTAPSGLRWRASAASGPWEVRVLSETGDEVLSTTAQGNALPWPTGLPLPAGRYLLTVKGQVAGLRSEGRASFGVLTVAETEAHAAALRAVDTVTDAALRPVLRAQLAIRRGLLEEAAQHLAQASPEVRTLADETAAYLERLRGGP